MTKAAAGGKVAEAPVVARLRERIARVFSYVEDAMYVGLGTHEFQASQDAVRDLKVGDSIEATLRALPKC